MDSLFAAIRKNALGLAIFAAVTAGLIAVIQVTTKETISHNIQQARVKALHEILPRDQHDNDLLNDAIWVTGKALGLNQPEEAFIAKKNGKAVVYFFPVKALEGYTGPISLVVGIRTSGELAGIRVLQHQETPGLGDQIELKKSDWVLSFNGLSLTNPDADGWKVQKDGGQFDQFTGATITPRAIVKAVHLALNAFEQHKQSLAVLPTHQSIEGAEASNVYELTYTSDSESDSDTKGE
jgi:electron transport complex protein RnfG